jgi:hypothetical protein
MKGKPNTLLCVAGCWVRYVWQTTLLLLLAQEQRDPTDQYGDGCHCNVYKDK